MGHYLKYLSQPSWKMDTKPISNHDEKLGKSPASPASITPDQIESQPDVAAQAIAGAFEVCISLAGTEISDSNTKSCQRRINS